MLLHSDYYKLGLPFTFITVSQPWAILSNLDLIISRWIVRFHGFSRGSLAALFSMRQTPRPRRHNGYPRRITNGQHHSNKKRKGEVVLAVTPAGWVGAMLAEYLHYRLTSDIRATTRKAMAAQKKLPVRNHTTKAIMPAGNTNRKTLAISMIMTSPTISSKNKKTTSPSNPKTWRGMRFKNDTCLYRFVAMLFLKSLWLCCYSYKSLLSIKTDYILGKRMSQKKEFQEIMAKSGLTDKSKELLWKLFYSSKEKLRQR